MKLKIFCCLKNDKQNELFSFMAIHGSGTHLDFGTEQIAIFLGELYFLAAIHFAS